MLAILFIGDVITVLRIPSTLLLRRTANGGILKDQQAPRACIESKPSFSGR
jgi:hypothetical protein